MTSSLVVTLKSARSGTDIADRFNISSSKPHAAAQALISYFEGVVAGLEPANFDIQTSSSAPVAATVTLTGVSVVATNAIAIGPTTFTYTASPTLSTDVMVTVPSAAVLASASDIAILTGKCTKTAHGFVTGDLGRFTTSNVLPTGLALSTDYFVIKVSADVFRVASSMANALAGIYVPITATGTGNQTFTLVANTYKACQLANAINAHATAGLIFTATYAANVVTLTAKKRGVAATYIPVSQSSGSTITVSSAYPAGGTGGATTAPVNYVFGL